MIRALLQRNAGTPTRKYSYANNNVTVKKMLSANSGSQYLGKILDKRLEAVWFW